MAVLAKDLQRRREEAFARACAAVESTRFRSLVLDTACWIEAGDWTRNPDHLTRLLREQPIVGAAADELRRRWKKILKAGAQLDGLDPQRRHKMRIQAKKLRYASEFFGGAFPGKKAMRRRKDFVAGLEKVQDALGELNDIAVHEGLSEQLVNAQDASGKQREGRAKKAFAAGRLSGREEARMASVLGQNVDHIDRLELAGDTDRQTFVGKLVEHVEHPVLASLVGAILDEVIGPDMIEPLWP